ncbi:MAG TPA: transporter [Nevskiales bacterium]|nr:transporter [Nevskiales bacterium]
MSRDTRQGFPRTLIVTGLCALVSSPAWAVEDASVQGFGRYKPLYPGLYATAHLAHDPRDAVFDADGDETGTSLPNLAGASEFPQTRGALAFQWYFPMFEAEQLPFLSSRLHTARLTFRAADVETRGTLETFIDANGLENNASGIGDLTFEFGSFLIGSDNWRERKTTPFAVLALVGVTLPSGDYDADAPVNTGTNQYAFHGTVGLHWQPADAWLLDAGLTWKTFDNNEEPAFGGNEPTQLGDLLITDLSLTRRLATGLYLGGFVQYQDGDTNEYGDVRFAVDTPAARPGREGTEPIPGEYRDDGTRLLSAGLSLNWFVAQNWLAGLHVVAPLDGESGEFTLPFQDRPAGCGVVRTGLCAPAPSGQSVTVDGLGGARSYASNIVLLTIGYSFGRGDPWY